MEEATGISFSGDDGIRGALVSIAAILPFLSFGILAPVPRAPLDILNPERVAATPPRCAAGKAAAIGINVRCSLAVPMVLVVPTTLSVGRDEGGTTEEESSGGGGR